MIKFYDIHNQVKNIHKIFLKKLKTEANLESNFEKLGINIKKDYENIISGVNLLILSNNPIKLEKKNLKKIILSWRRKY